uniref:Uncharacterized protein n=1 Tax=Panagrolaimus davidi TaxID=227884 RepID=A0A914PTK0_9BILA
MNDPYEIFNDAIVMFYLCEKLFLTGHLVSIENLQIKAERRRVAAFFDLINSPRWNKNWPPTLRIEVRADPSVENLATGIESLSFSTAVEASNSPSSINDYNDHLDDPASPRPSSPQRSLSLVTGLEEPLSTYNANDFDEVQQPPSPFPLALPSAFPEPLSTLPSSSASVPPHLHSPLPVETSESLSFATAVEASNSTSSNNDYNYDPASPRPSSPQRVVSLSYGSSPLMLNSYGTGSNYSPPIVSRSLSVRSYREGSPDPSEGSQMFDFNDNRERPFSDNSEDASSADETDYSATQKIREMRCRRIEIEIRKYWECVRTLFEIREKIISRLQQQLAKERCYSFDETARINAKVQLIENDLNEWIPVIPKWKASFQRGPNKNTIIRKGFIYQRIDDTNQFQCKFVYQPFRPCYSYIEIDEADNIIEGSFCNHFHHGSNYTEDEPSPRATPVSLTRIHGPTVTGKPKYQKMMEMIDKFMHDMVDWRAKTHLCLNNMELIHRCITKLEENQNEFFNSRSKRISTKMVVQEAKNILKCIRLDKRQD